MTVHVLRPLDEAAIASWLSAVTGNAFSRDDPLVDRIKTASEGVPLFADFLIPHAVALSHSGAINLFPESFSAYAIRQLRDLGDGLYSSQAGPWSWDTVLSLFALLCVAKVPLPPIWVHGFFGGARLDQLDQRVDRWFWIREDGVSLAHPRLATVFKSVLPQFDVAVSEIEEKFVEFCQKVWRSSKKEPLKAYALTWLPNHWWDKASPARLRSYLAMAHSISRASYQTRPEPPCR